jgi:hypothetical protein
MAEQKSRSGADKRPGRERPIPLKSGNSPRKSAGAKVHLDEGLTPFPRAFAAEHGSNPAHLQSELRAQITDLAKLRERNPFGNPVKLLALELNKRLDRDALDFGAIEDLISISPAKPSPIARPACRIISARSTSSGTRSACARCFAVAPALPARGASRSTRSPSSRC